MRATADPAAPSPAPALLVVDDAQWVRDLLRAALRPLGFTVLEAADGREAVSVYRRHRQAVRLVLLDVRLPGLNGPQALAELRGINPSVRCWFLSGVLDASDEPGLLALGAARVFPKPLPMGPFLQAVGELAPAAAGAA